jgi:hypothetical protein
MNGILHSIKQTPAKLIFRFVNNWTPLKCSEDKFFYDSHFVAALVFFIATVERTVIALYSLSQSNPVTASNFYQFDRIITMDTLPNLAYDNATGVTPYDLATVAFFVKNQIQNTQSGRSKRLVKEEIEGLLS